MLKRSESPVGRQTVFEIERGNNRFELLLIVFTFVRCSSLNENRSNFFVGKKTDAPKQMIHSPPHGRGFFKPFVYSTEDAFSAIQSSHYFLSFPDLNHSLPLEFRVLSHEEKWAHFKNGQAEMFSKLQILVSLTPRLNLLMPRLTFPSPNFPKYRSTLK